MPTLWVKVRCHDPVPVEKSVRSSMGLGPELKTRRLSSQQGMAYQPSSLDLQESLSKRKNRAILSLSPGSIVQETVVG